MASENETTPNPSTAEQRFKLGEKEYTAGELQEALRGGLREADYTRKTQQVAEERRRLEEFEAELEERAAELERAAVLRPDATEDDDPWVQRFTTLESKLEGINRALTAKEQSDAKEREVASQMEAIEASLHALANKPGFDRQEVLQTMQEYGWQRPEDVAAAYRIVAGPKIAQSMAERAATSRGAGEPPPMGATGFPMTTPFSSPGEAAPGQFDASKVGWHDLKRMAMEDPSRPR